jgi:apolipoprotein N-acyltransferase
VLDGVKEYLPACLSLPAQQPDFIVWPENEFADADDAYFMDQLKGLSTESGSYIVADVVWQAETGMHDTALLVGPTGDEVGRRAKINTTDGEENVGFVPGPLDYPVFDTPHGKVGLGVCWDRHRLFITRELTRSGAEIVLMTVDDDFNGTPTVSVVTDAYGRVVNRVDIFEEENAGAWGGEQMVMTPVGSIETLYPKIGDIFGLAMLVGLVGLLVFAWIKRK